jgi:hypothetical protein
VQLRKKKKLVNQSTTSNNNYQQKVQQPTTQKEPAVMFRYTGKTALTVTGSTSRKSYRFNFPGDIQHIEFSDVAAMNEVPVLKRV